MSKLLQRLSDARKSGVYRASRVDSIEDSLRGSKLSFGRIPLHDAKDKSALLGRIAARLGFPVEELFPPPPQEVFDRIQQQLMQQQAPVPQGTRQEVR